MPAALPWHNFSLSASVVLAVSVRFLSGGAFAGAMFAAIILLALLPSALAAGPASPLQQRTTASELAVLARGGDAVQLWDAATRAAAAAVVSELRRQDPSSTAEIKGIDLEQLRIWNGASLTLGLQADSQKYSFVVQSEQDWRSLAEALPATQVRVCVHPADVEARTPALRLAAGQVCRVQSADKAGLREDQLLPGCTFAGFGRLLERQLAARLPRLRPMTPGTALPCRAACCRGTTGTQLTETGCRRSAAAACCQTLLWRAPWMFTCSSPLRCRWVWGGRQGRGDEFVL